jgi:hypothetical protein
MAELPAHSNISGSIVSAFSNLAASPDDSKNGVKQ